MRRAAILLALAALALSGASPAPAPVDLSVVLAEAPAAKLSDYRLFVDAGARQPNGRVTPYDVATPLFSDYAVKHRYVFTPKGEPAAWRDQGPLAFPVGTVLVKTFAYPADFRRPEQDERFLETRLLIRKAGGWTAQTYLWNAEQTEATLKRVGARLDVSFIGQDGAPVAFEYAVPNQNQCKECHSADGVMQPIGPKARNLNHDFAYREGTRNQLSQWRTLGLLADGPAPADAPRTADWTDASAGLEQRARAYLDANCGHCHNPAGMASTSGLFLNAEEDRPAHLGLNKAPVAAGRGSGGLKVSIDPGHPERSILIHRMASDDPGVMMPELGRALVHEEGVAVVAAYIASLKPAP